MRDQQRGFSGNTAADPNSAPGASATGGKPKPASAAEVKKMDTTDPNSATTSGQSMGAKHKAKKKKTSNM